MKQKAEVILEQSPVELFKILKFEGIASSGAEAKQMIADGMISVNGEVELRKRKKIVAGDIIELDDIELTVR
jgi:ribosome-associated protein